MGYINRYNLEDIKQVLKEYENGLYDEDYNITVMKLMGLLEVLLNQFVEKRFDLKDKGLITKTVYMVNNIREAAKAEGFNVDSSLIAVKKMLEDRSKDHLCSKRTYLKSLIDCLGEKINLEEIKEDSKAYFPIKPRLLPCNNRDYYEGEYIFAVDGKKTKLREDALSIAKLDNGNILFRIYYIDFAKYLYSDRECLNDIVGKYAPSSKEFKDKKKRVQDIIPDDNERCNYSLGGGMKLYLRGYEFEIDLKQNEAYFNIIQKVDKIDNIFSHSEINQILRGKTENKQLEESNCLIDEIVPFINISLVRDFPREREIKRGIDKTFIYKEESLYRYVCENIKSMHKTPGQISKYIIRKVKKRLGQEGLFTYELRDKYIAELLSSKEFHSFINEQESYDYYHKNQLFMELVNIYILRYINSYGLTLFSPKKGRENKVDVKKLNHDYIPPLNNKDLYSDLVYYTRISKPLVRYEALFCQLYQDMIYEVDDKLENKNNYPVRL